MDNFHVIVQSKGREDFKTAMALFFKKNKAIAYSVDIENGLIFHHSKNIEASPLPFEMDLEAAVSFAWGWLEKVIYPIPPDHDGDNGKGFCVYNEAWGRIGEKWSSFVAIKPVWALYGK